MLPVSVIVIIIVIVVILLAIITFIAICKQNKNQRVRSEEVIKPSIHRLRRNSHIADLSFAHHRHSTQLNEAPLEQIKDAEYGENETDNGRQPPSIFVVQNTGSGQGPSQGHRSGFSPPHADEGPSASTPIGSSRRPVAILKQNAYDIEFPEALPAIARQTRTDNVMPDYKPAPLPPISSVSAQPNPDNLRGDDIP